MLIDLRDLIVLMMMSDDNQSRMIRTTEKNGKEVQVRNYLGEKRVRVVPMIADVICKRSEDGTKDEIILSGNDLDAVSQSAANIWGAARCKDKDIRKYLDGVYVSYRGNVLQDE